MSLLMEAFEPCTMIDKTSVANPYGGADTVYKDGASIKCAITLDTSTEARIAEMQGVKNLYTITTTRAVNLQHHDLLRRESDKKVFRVTSDGDDKKTPLSAGLDMRVVSAEEWKIPNG